MLAAQSFGPLATASRFQSSCRSSAFGSSISLSTSRILSVDHAAASSGFLSARAASPQQLARPVRATSPPHPTASPQQLARPVRAPSPLHQGISLSATSQQLSSQQCPGAGPSSGLMSASGICRSPLLLHRRIASPAPQSVESNAPSRSTAAGLRAPDAGSWRWRDAGDSSLKAAPHRGNRSVQWAPDAVPGSHTDVNQMTQAYRPSWHDLHVSLAEPAVDGNLQQPSSSSMMTGTADASSSSRSVTPQNCRGAYCAGSGGGGTGQAHPVRSSSLNRETRTLLAAVLQQGSPEQPEQCCRAAGQPQVLQVLQARPPGDAQGKELDRLRVQAQCPVPDQERLVTLQTQASSDLQAKVQELARQKEELERKLNEDSQCFVQSLLGLEQEVQELREKNRLLEETRAAAARDEELRAAVEEERQAKEVQIQELVAINAKLESDCQDTMQQFEAAERERNEEASRVREEAALLQTKLLEQEQAFQRRLQEVERDRENLLQLMSDESKELQSRVDKLTEDKEAMSLDLARALARADLGDATASAPEGSPRESRDKERADALRRSQSECEVLKDEVAIKEGQLVLLRNQLEIAERKLRLSDMENTMLKSELEASRRNAEGGCRTTSRTQTKEAT